MSVFGFKFPADFIEWRIFYMKTAKLIMKMVSLYGVTFLLGACAIDEPIIQPTSSGKPEQIYDNLSPERLRNILQSLCNESGGRQEASASNAVTCAWENKGVTSNAVMSALMGNREYAAPIFKEQYTVIPWNNGKQTKVYVDFWTEMAGNYGHTHRTSINTGGKIHNRIQNGLNQIKASLDVKPQDGDAVTGNTSILQEQAIMPQ